MIYFFTYGDHNYTTSKERIKREALNCGYFDKVDVYGKEDLSSDFITKTEPYINHPRGGGYWIWKTHLLKKTFDKMEIGDYCVYVDAGCSINPMGADRFNFYLSLLDENGSGIFRLKHGGSPIDRFTNEKVFEFFDGSNDSVLRKSDVLMGGVMIFKKNERSQRFVDRYLELAENHAYLFSDEFNDYKRTEVFTDHRHDQSVSSCLTRREFQDAVTFQDETYAADIDGWIHLFEVVKVPFLATRIRG